MILDELIKRLEEIKTKYNGELPVFISLACAGQEFRVLSWNETKNNDIEVDNDRGRTNQAS